MSDDFKIQVKKNSDMCMVSLSGRLSTSIQFPEIIHTKNIVMDCSALTSINSSGVKAWIHWVSSLRQSKIFLENCPAFMVIQFGQVGGFLTDNMTVGSFFVPYFSEETSEAKTVLYRKGTEYTDDGTMMWPEVRDSAGNIMEVDAIESQYFSFLKKAK